MKYALKWVNEGCIKRLQQGFSILLMYPAQKRTLFEMGEIIGVKEPHEAAIAVCIWIKDDKLVKRETYEGFRYSDGVWNFPDMPDFEETAAEDACKPLVIKEAVGKHVVPADFLPANGVRLFAKVTNISIRNIQDLEEEDAIMAGYPDGPAGDDSPLELFAQNWARTYGANRRRDMSWYANPEVKVIELTPCTPF